LRPSSQENDSVKNPSPRGTRERWKSYGEKARGPLAYSAVGLEFGLSVTLGYFGGKALDDWLGTEPWMMFSMVLLGIGSAFYSLYRTVKRALKEMDD